MFFKSKMFRVVTAVALLASILMGCSLAPGGKQYIAFADTVARTATEDRQHYNDVKAETVLSAVCDVSIGAYARMPSGNKKDGMALLCGLAPDPRAIRIPRNYDIGGAEVN